MVLAPIVRSLLVTLTLASTAAAQEATAISGGPPAIVSFRSTSPDTVIRDVIRGAEHSASSGVYSAWASSTLRKPLCVAPCEIALSPGYHEIEMSTGDAHATRAFQLSPGRQTIVAKPANTTVQSIGHFFRTTGFLAALLGGSVYAFAKLDSKQRVPEKYENISLITTIAGGGVYVIGLPMSLIPSSSLEREGAQPVAARPMVGARVSGAF